jgi:hypothetical protein
MNGSLRFRPTATLAVRQPRSGGIPMRRLVTLAFALSAALAFAMTAPPQASACTGCSTTFEEFVRGNDRIVLVRYAGRTGGRFVYHVADVLKGQSPAILRFKFDPVGRRQPPRIGSRWLISTYVPPDGLLRANVVFRVSPNGVVTPTETGEGAVVAPGTLSGWYRAIARLLPDTATAAPAGGPAQLPEMPGPLIVVTALLSGVAMLRRLARKGLGSTTLLSNCPAGLTSA